MSKQKPKIKPIDLSKESLMKQPTAYTLMPKKATLTQMKVFVVIMYRLQAFFNKVIEEKYKTPAKTQQLFLDFAADNGEFVIANETTKLIDQGDVLIDIPLRDLHIEPKNYPAAVETLWRVASTPCVITDEETGEQKITNFMYLVKGGNVTATKEKVTEQDPVTGKTVTREVERIHYKQPRIRMGIPRAVAGQIFDIDIRGYDQFNLPAALAAGSVYTLLIYILVSGQYHRGNNQFQKDYTELREELGFFDSPTEKNANKYIEWSQFERGVIKVAKDELDRKLKDGEIDMSFDYEPVFERWINPDTGRPKRIVQRITFRIIPSASIAHLLTIQPTDTDQLIRRMIGELQLTPAQVNGKRKGFLTRAKEILGAEGIVIMRTKVEELINEKNTRTDIINVGKWACTSLNKWILEVKSKSDWVGDGSGKHTGNAQPTANSQGPFNSSTGQLNSSTGPLVNSSTSSSFNALGDRLRFTPDEEQRLQAFKNDCKADATIPVAAFKSDIEPLQFHHTSPNGLFIVLYNPSGDKVTPGRLHYHSIYEQVLRHWHAHFPDHTLNFD